MDLDIRKHVIKNIKDSSNEELNNMVVDAINSKDEMLLPSLGTIFELIWENSDNSEKETYISKLKKGLS